jgi:hypothetical protein
MAVCAWHEPSPACRGRWTGRHRCSGAGLRLFCSFSKDPFLQQRERGGRATGRVEELFQWLYAISAHPPQTFLASGAVGSAVLGWMAAPPPLLKDPLPEPSAGEDRRMVGRRQSITGDTHELCDGPLRLGGGMGGLGAAVRFYLATVPPSKWEGSAGWAATLPCSALRSDAR